MKGTIAMNWGKWGGVYLHCGNTKRLCLGWLAVSWFPCDIDQVVEQTMAIAREEGFLKGFQHGQNKCIPLQRKLDIARTDAQRWRQRYKSEVPSLKGYIALLRQVVPRDAFHALMTTKRPPRRSTRARMSGRFAESLESFQLRKTK